MRITAVFELIAEQSSDPPVTGKAEEVSFFDVATRTDVEQSMNISLDQTMTFEQQASFRYILDLDGLETFKPIELDLCHSIDRRPR